MFMKHDPLSIEIRGKPLKCLVCGHDEFHTRDAQLNTAGMSFLNLDWINPTGRCYICARCGYIHWFLPP